MATTSNNTFWASGHVEPKRSYRFLLQVNGIESWVVTKVKRPAFKVGEISHDYINHKFWYPGRVEWDPVTVTLVDAITFDTTGALMTMLMASGYRLPMVSNSTRTINKFEATQAVGGSVAIVGLGAHPVDPTDNSQELGTVVNEHEAGYVEKWELINPWIQAVTMGDYSYADDALIEMELTFRYDFAKYNLMEGLTELENWQGRVNKFDGNSIPGMVLKNASNLIAGKGS